MIRLRTIIIVIVIYVISYLSLRFNINILYPYYLVKDYLLYPVLALKNPNSLEYSNRQYESIINELKADLDSIKKLSGIKSVNSDFSIINASVLERNRNYWFNSLTIDKGKNDGLEVDMAVINHDGLIGRISKVNELTSEIKLITTNDVNSKISTVIDNNGENIYGIMNGYDSDNDALMITLTTKNIDILEGSLVKTTGMGGVFPSGILIGEVLTTKSDNYDVGMIVLVRPMSKINDLRYVSILKRNN